MPVRTVSLLLLFPLLLAACTTAGPPPTRAFDTGRGNSADRQLPPPGNPSSR